MSIETTLNVLWLLICASLVFLMQAGFLCLETGFTRSKNNIHVALKNIFDFTVSTLLFYLLGFTVMFGEFGKNLLPVFEDGYGVAFFIFQAMFCGTTITIISGSIAERTKFRAYVQISVLMAAIIYPLLGRWVWGATGWLRELGFVDFAGSTVVHSTGGWAALALLLILGPRNGRFSPDHNRNIQGANIPFATFGALLLFIGWIGFNGGSTFALTEQTPAIILNTLLGGCAGAVAAAGYSQWQNSFVSAESVINGGLAGLVAITAGAHVMMPQTAVLVGSIGAITMLLFKSLLIRFKIDDAIGAVPVHLGAGIWGTLAVGLLGNPLLLNNGLTRLEQTGIQLIGIGIAPLWVLTTVYLSFTLINRFFPIRVSSENEEIGLNIAEHHASTDLIELFMVMEKQAKTGELNLRVPVEPFTEVGQIANRYNQVLDNLQETTQHLQTTINNSPLILFAINKEGNFILAEGKGLQRLGLKPKQLIGQSIYTVYGNNVNLIGNFEKTLAGETVRNSIRVNDLTFEAIFEPIYQNSDVIGVTGVAYDITEQIQTNAALTQAYKQAQQANQFKTELLAKVSHELRTPLGIIMAYGEMLQHGMYGEMSEKQAEKSYAIVQSAQDLTNMVNELLDEAQLESGTIKLNSNVFDLQRLLEDVDQQMSILAEEKGLSFACHYSTHLPDQIIGDPIRLKQILINLLGNGIKFTNEGFVSLMTSRVSPTRLSFIVKDSGPGIPEDMQKAIFEPFRQVEHNLTTQKGSGLGLSIANKIVNLMDGQLTVESTPGNGSTFTAVLPFVEP